jgi:ketol-acid reductoisomerase
MENTRTDMNHRSIKEYMRKKLRDIDNGKFATEWHVEREAGYPRFNRLFKKYTNSDMIKDEQMTFAQLKGLE